MVLRSPERTQSGRFSAELRRSGRHRAPPRRIETVLDGPSSSAASSALTVVPKHVVHPGRLRAGPRRGGLLNALAMGTRGGLSAQTSPKQAEIRPIRGPARPIPEMRKPAWLLAWTGRRHHRQRPSLHAGGRWFDPSTAHSAQSPGRADFFRESVPARGASVPASRTRFLCAAGRRGSGRSRP